MFQFQFSNKQIVSRNKTSYPVTLADVKLKSLYYQDNPTDTSQDSFVNDFLIPTIVDNWEYSTNYLLLDQNLKTYVPNIQYINDNSLEMSLYYLNIRSVENVSYFPLEWNEVDPKTILPSTDYLVTTELLKTSSKLKIKKDNLPIILFNITNNLQADILAGFENNDFTNLDPEIKEALAMQVATALDVREGYCKGYYKEKIEEIYEKFSIQKQLISFI
jgi:hypothetical protein